MKILCVWNELQKIPASVYGKAVCGEGNFEIRVCKNAAKERDKLLKNGFDVIVYNFSGSSGSGAR